MTEQQGRKLMQLHVESLQGVAEFCTPVEFRSWLAGLVANIVGNIPDDEWKVFAKVEPCGAPGCDSHLGVREDFKKYGPAIREVKE